VVEHFGGAYGNCKWRDYVARCYSLSLASLNNEDRDKNDIPSLVGLRRLPALVQLYLLMSSGLSKDPIVL
jgi:hypothetical protein